LEWETPFNENSVDGFIKEYKDTISFSKLSESDILASEDGSKEDDDSKPSTPEVGDYVQWESQGIMQCKEPVRVTGISTDGTHAFVEGTSTGLPVRQLRRATAPATPPTQARLQPQSRALLLPTTAMQEDVYSLPEGRIVIQWPSALSAESIQDVKDWLKLVEQKIARSQAVQSNESQPE